MKLYGNDFSPNSNKVRYAINAMGLDYEFQTIDLAAGEQRTESFTKINPVGRIPALADGDFTIFESNAIMRYLAERTGSPLYPKDLKARSIVNQWLDFGSIHLAAGAMGKIFFNTIIYKFINASKDENSLEEGRKFLASHLKLIDTQLGKTVYICGGEITLADIGILAVLDPCEVVGFDLSPYPKVIVWRNKLQAQAFYQKQHKSYTDYVESLSQKV